jgi:pSer/pThr/pTyr-binding forkhead associated (FHA) protein
VTSTILQDLASTNGTFLNGRRLIAPQSLQNGDRIMMGNTEWVYRAGSDTAAMKRR